MESHMFGFLGVRQFFIFTVSKRTRMFCTVDEVKCSSFNLKNGSIRKNIYMGLSWDHENYIFAPK